MPLKINPRADSHDDNRAPHNSKDNTICIETKITRKVS